MSRETVAARIAAHPVSGSPEEMRVAFAKLAGTSNTGDLQVKGGIRARVIGDGPDVVWLHGGGYVFGTLETHARCAAYLAKASATRVWLPEYRLAPEHTWPAQLEDILQFLDRFDHQVCLVGDSAGGHLALNVALCRRDRIKAMALISPNTDRSGRSQTRERNSDHDLMNDDAQDRALAALAMPDLASNTPEVSPLLADLHGLPSTFLAARTTEVLLDDTLLLIRAMALAGVPVTAKISAGLFHMWTLWPDELAEARVTLDQIARFFADQALSAEHRPT